jgi:hypothetical protein
VEIPDAHLGLVGLEQLPVHADRRIVAHADVGLVDVEQHHFDVGLTAHQ